MKPRLLVVEDTALNRDLFQQLLEDEYELVFEIDGVRALAAVEREPFDGILLDISIPRIDGIEVARRIRAREASHGHSRVPIIAVTAHAMRGDRERSLSAGCDDHVTKPIEEEVLFAALRRLVKSK